MGRTTEAVRHWFGWQDDQVQGGPAEEREIGTTTETPPFVGRVLGTRKVEQGK